MARASSLILFVLLFTGCPQGPQHPHVHQPTDTADCPKACQHLRDLHCQEGDTVAGGWCEDGSSPQAGKCASGLPAGDLTCERFCQQTQDSGHALTPSCVVNIKQCSDMDSLDAFCPAGYHR